jgi:hypothetical protein
MARIGPASFATCDSSLGTTRVVASREAEAGAAFDDVPLAGAGTYHSADVLTGAFAEPAASAAAASSRLKPAA